MRRGVDELWLPLNRCSLKQAGILDCQRPCRWYVSQHCIGVILKGGVLASDERDSANPERGAVDDDAQRQSGARSPWLDQLGPRLVPTPLTGDVKTDVAIIGAGIAGIATAFFLLRATEDKVLLVERTQAGHGASGRNAGQLVTYFERPLCDLADAYGFDMAVSGQAEIDAAWGLLDLIVAETGISAKVERIDGAMGMFTLNHLLVHLRNLRIRKQAGLEQEIIEISEEAAFLGEIPAAFRDLYTIVSQARIRQRLGVDLDDYVAVLVNKKGCGNSALLCQDLLAYFKRQYPDRFEYADQTIVGHIVLEADRAVLNAGPHLITASRVILCTNAFSHHTVENRFGEKIEAVSENQMRARIGYMAAFKTPPGDAPAATSYITNAEIGGPSPYLYMTRRPYHQGDQEATLTCIGGPEARVESLDSYAPDAEMPSEMLRLLDTQVRPAVAPNRPEGLDYDYRWHGLMAYTETMVRLIGFDPCNRVLMYNLGCNGVGFLPSIAGGLRIARLHAGQEMAASIFDPK